MRLPSQAELSGGPSSTPEGSESDPSSASDPDDRDAGGADNLLHGSERSSVTSSCSFRGTRSGASSSSSSYSSAHLHRTRSAAQSEGAHRSAWSSDDASRRSHDTSTSDVELLIGSSNGGSSSSGSGSITSSSGSGDASATASSSSSSNTGSFSRTSSSSGSFATDSRLQTSRTVSRSSSSAASAASSYATTSRGTTELADSSEGRQHDDGDADESVSEITLRARQLRAREKIFLFAPSTSSSSSASSSSSGSSSGSSSSSSSIAPAAKSKAAKPAVGEGETAGESNSAQRGVDEDAPSAGGRAPKDGKINPADGEKGEDQDFAANSNSSANGSSDPLTASEMTAFSSAAGMSVFAPSARNGGARTSGSQRQRLKLRHLQERTRRGLAAVSV